MNRNELIQKKRFVYADNAATTQISDEVIQAMLPWLREGGYGNPSSIYELGRRAGFAIEDARKQVADALGDTGRILVRESGTEPLIRVMVEAESEEQCHAYVDQVVDVIRARGHELVQ